VPNGGATNGRDLNGGRHRKLNRETRRGRGYCAEAVWVRRVRCSAIDSGRCWCMLGTRKEAEGREPNGRRCRRCCCVLEQKIKEGGRRCTCRGPRVGWVEVCGGQMAR